MGDLSKFSCAGIVQHFSGQWNKRFLSLCSGPEVLVLSMRWQQLEQSVTGLLKVCYEQISPLPAALDVELLHGWQLCSGDVLRSF